MTTTEQKRITVLLVEDHEVTRVGLRSLLQGFDHLSVVAEAATAMAAVELAQSHQPDVVLLDIRLADGSGFDACRAMQKLGLDCKVLFLTSYADDEILFEAIACGADGYLLKEINGRALITAIEDVAAGRSILDPAVTRRVLSRVRQVQPSPIVDERLNLLSPQEMRIVSLVSEGKTNKEIASVMGLSDKTVKNYLSNAMDKLKASRRTEVAALYLQQGRK